MDFETLFLSDFCIEKKPDNLLDLIERAVAVAEFKYRPELEKRRNRIIKCMMNPGKLDYDDEDTSTLDDDDDEEEEDDNSVGDEEEDCVGDEEEEDEVTNVEEEKQQITVPTNQKPTMKIKLKIKKSVEVAAPLEKHNNCNAMEELKETDLQLDANKETTRQSHTMGTTRNRNVPTQVASKKLVSDFSFEKQLDGDKQQSPKSFKKMENLKSEQRRECTTKRMPPPLMKMYAATKPKIVAPTPHQKLLLSDCSTKKQSHQGFKKMENLKSEQRKECTSALAKRMPPPSTKMNVATKSEIVAPTPHQKQLLSNCSPKKQSHKGFKKMDNLTGNKSEQRKECTSALTKCMSPPSMKMNVATKSKIVAPTPHQKLLSDCSPKKQSKYSAITRPMQKKTTQSSQVVRPMQKETESIRDDRNMKFESSKRKFEQTFAEQREAKRRIMMVDFHDMPNPPNDPCAPRRRCWNRRF